MLFSVVCSLILAFFTCLGFIILLVIQVDHRVRSAVFEFERALKQTPSQFLQWFLQR